MNSFPTQPESEPGSIAPPSDWKPSIMILDDNDTDIEALRRCLRSIPGMDTKLTGCVDLATASVHVASQQYDVLFVDYDLIEMSGLDALAFLRAEGCRTPAILLTGSHGERVLHEALRAGVMDYIPKDGMTPALLEQTIRSALEKAELNAKIERKQEELEYTIESLRKRSQEVESFYHNVSHELRTPLTGAREFVSLMQEGAAGPLTESQASLLAAAVRNCDQMAHCVNDMIDAARIETGKLILSAKEHDLVSAIRDAVESVRSLAGPKEIEIRLAGMRSPVTGVFDLHRIYQVAANLISNAIKFTPHSGVVAVEVSTQPDGCLQVLVGDSGPGIPEGDEERIFDRLYQSNAKDAALLGGLGMGLFISQEIIELHQGEITYAPSPLGGAQITFTLPQRALVAAAGDAA